MVIFGGCSNNCNNNKSVNQLSTNKPTKAVTVILFYNNLGYINLVFYIFILIIFLLHLFVIYLQISCPSIHCIFQILIAISYLLLFYTLQVACLLVFILFNHTYHSLPSLMPLSWLTVTCITSSRLPGSRLLNRWLEVCHDAGIAQLLIKLL